MQPALCILTLAGLLLAAPSASAASHSPTDLRATDTDEGTLLTWSAPEDQEVDEYRVYADGTLVDTRTTTSALVEWAGWYAVTAVVDGEESTPILTTGARAVFVGGGGGSGSCDPLPTTIDPSTPSIDPRFREECFDGVWDQIGFRPSDIIP